MIKLNNKNITYVALADSNNSVKGVKEIWYADSNNSVKLVYRGKDALIEGVDYEKYHWLVGDADAYINTLNNYHPYEDSVSMLFRDNLYPNRESKYNKYNAEEQIWGACNSTDLIVRSYISGTSYDSTNKISNNVINASTADSEVNWGGYANRSLINDSPEHQLYISNVDSNTDKYYFIYNGDTKGNLPTRYTLPEIINQDVCVFHSNQVINGYFNGSFFNFIHYRNNVEITHLIPCKLLKPVPKRLDANGIRRNIGECGMIDLVSGKFYGNVNSVGTFTVENYYERKEWLKGDGSAYIDTDIIVDVPSLYISTSFTKKVGNSTPLFGSRNYVTSNGSQIWYLPSGQLRLDIITNGTNWVTFGSWNIRNINQLIVNCPNNVVNINGTDISSEVTYLSIKNSIYTFKIFSLECLNDVGSDANVPYHGAFGNFILNDSTHSLNLIPCTLTTDLPASMDANNIARTKGTSGMWDLVSDKFYGNVANSGTFKAVNLAEGVDYEVHQWLRVEISANEARSFMTLPLNSSVFEFKRKFDVFGNLPYFSSNKYTYVTGSGKKVAIYDKVNGGQIEISNFTLNVGDVVDVVCDGQELYFNNQQFTMYENPWRIIYFRLNSAGSADFSTSKISIDGVERYIPIKLLKSIPAKYDANGIARQVGECGMYDTVNDKFYGNVASSGSFTVEDDN